MISDDSYEPPFPADADSTGEMETTADETLGESNDSNNDAQELEETREAKAAWERNRLEPSSDDPASSLEEGAEAEESDPHLRELAEPFVGQWKGLISKTNWEKGRIINEWRAKLVDSGASVTEFSDEAWARRVGGVTAPHVGRLRRVHDRFASTHESYEGIYWSHFLAAIDWDDAPLWLEGASREGWSVSQMREHRWQAQGAVESQRPTASQIVEVDTDEDVVLPAQGGGGGTQSGEEPSGITSGPAYEPPDFGDEDELTAIGPNDDRGQQTGGMAADQDDDDWQSPVQPFKGLPELPDDLADAVEQLKLAILRYKTDQWKAVDADTIQKYLDAMGVLVRS